MLNKIIVVILIFVLGLSSCNEDDIDLSAPTFESVTFSPLPTAATVCGTAEDTVFLLRGGQTLSFEGIFKDNIALSQYKIDIHHNFDCHGHGAGAAPNITLPNVNNQTTDWSVLEIINLTGQQELVQKSLFVPENVTAGNYHFQIRAIDASGNETPFSAFSAKVTNPIDDVPPTIAIEKPAQQQFTAEKGSILQFKGNLSDNYSLSEGGNGMLFLSYTDLNSGNSFTTNKVFAIDETHNETYLFDFNYTIPNTLTVGNYRFTLNAMDGVRNIADVVSFDVVVTN